MALEWHRDNKGRWAARGCCRNYHIEPTKPRASLYWRGFDSRTVPTYLKYSGGGTVAWCKAKAERLEAKDKTGRW